MKTAFTLLICVTSIALTSLAWAQVIASEGRVNVAPQAPEAARVAHYGDGPAAMPGATDKQAKLSPKIEYRAAPDKSSRASDFTIYDAGRVLIADRDSDGYHSEFRIRFDADVNFGDALVYAKLYLRRVGDTGGWRLYHTTDDFWIYGQSDSDDYYVDTTLDEGFPTGEYDVLIDLYESGYSGVVATIAAYDTSALGYLPLEEVGLDVPVALPGYSINSVSSALLIDDDHDGYYSKFRITFDPDSEIGTNYVYAVMWMRPQGGVWIKEHTSSNFRVDPNGTADTYSFTGDWLSGYPTANYDVQIDLFDASSGLLVASAGSERPALSRLPLEDATRDRVVNSPSTGSSGYASSTEHGGGAISLWFALSLALIAIARKHAAVRKIRAEVAARARRRE